jgi:hypothetical protein
MMNKMHNALNNARNARKVKSDRIRRNKANFVKRNLTRLWGADLANSWFSGTKWAKYVEDEYADMPALIHITPEQRYANLLQGNPYVRAEAERRLALGLNFENTVRNALTSIQCDAQRVTDVYNEVNARIQRNDEVFETAVSNMMYDLHNA